MKDEADAVKDGGTSAGPEDAGFWQVDARGTDRHVVRREYGCINGLSAWFTLVEVEVDEGCIAMTDGAIDDSATLAAKVALGLNLVDALGEGDARAMLSARREHGGEDGPGPDGEDAFLAWIGAMNASLPDGAARRAVARAVAIAVARGRTP